MDGIVTALQYSRLYRTTSLFQIILNNVFRRQPVEYFLFTKLQTDSKTTMAKKRLNQSMIMMYTVIRGDEH